ncbi:MAG: peptide chain release factor N(5)-glutamine methyltransferase [Microbacteriaceae bacterium]|nr:peptide chain release factor N(5)-glutamine methyltransferase [Microbacteriaceae bacterium]
MKPSTSIRVIRNESLKRLSQAGIQNAEVDFELLLGHVLGISRGEVQSKVALDADLPTAVADELDRLVARRFEREPLQHITGRAAFRNLKLLVGPGAFVPRPETELTAQIAIDALNAFELPEPIALDLGTGTGAIALAIATEVSRARVFAIEKSAEAFAWAQKNVEHLGVSTLEILHGEIEGSFSQLDGKASVVVSNPPYIPVDAVPRDPEVQKFDPPLALYGGEDGLDVIRTVSSTAQRLLHPGGLVVIEHGELQGAAVRELFANDGWHAISTQKDLLGRDRVSTAVR